MLIFITVRKIYYYYYYIVGIYNSNYYNYKQLVLIIKQGPNPSKSNVYALPQLVPSILWEQHDLRHLHLCHESCSRFTKCDALLPNELRDERVDD